MGKKSFEDIKVLFQASEDAITIKNNKEMFEKTIKNIARDKYETQWNLDKKTSKLILLVPIIIIIGIIFRILFNPTAPVTMLTFLLFLMLSIFPIRQYIYTKSKKTINKNLSVKAYHEEVISFFKDKIKYEEANSYFLPFLFPLIFTIYFYEEFLAFGILIKIS